MPHRKPFAVANWKMAMTIAESQRFVRAFQRYVGNLAADVDIVLCPPCTALYPVAQALADSPIGLGAQNLTAATGESHTGEISAALLRDVGCRWVLIGHWETRRRAGETDADINRKIHGALSAELRPILLVGESTEERKDAEAALRQRLPSLFAAIGASQVTRMVMIYEPEWTIGVREPAEADYVAAGCCVIRQWIGEAYDQGTARQVRTIYGGSVTPVHAKALLSSPQVDGLGAGRQGRNARAFAEIVRSIAEAKGLASSSPTA
jgi:triosephosphate isomerase